MDNDFKLYVRLLKESPGTVPDVESRYYDEDHEDINSREETFWASIEYGLLERVYDAFYWFETTYTNLVTARLKIWTDRTNQAVLIREGTDALTDTESPPTPYEVFASAGFAQATKNIVIYKQRMQKAREAMEEMEKKVARNNM
jgi:hypothetical protein